MGAKSAADLANEIRSSLHFDSFSWNLFWLDLAISSSTSDWIRLSSFLSTHSAIVVSSTYFHSSVLLVLDGLILTWKHEEVDTNRERETLLKWYKGPSIIQRLGR